MPENASGVVRRLPVGAEVQPDGSVHFRVWAPNAGRVAVALEDSASNPQPPVSLAAEENGYFSGLATQATVGSRYGYLLDDDQRPYPDPASRYQPDGPHGLSQVVTPQGYTWHDAGWQGVGLRGQVIYEMHIGTFTPEGTWQAAIEHLPYLAELGITAIEVMPVAEFDGTFGWGYDGVNLFAPTRLYGTPDDFRRFVDAAHQNNLGVLLDVVYNHFGPTGNYIPRFSTDYFAPHRHTDWGDPINFDGPHNKPVREFYLANAAYWIEEFHLDGLRLDAVHAIFDDSAEHILTGIGCRVRQAAHGRNTLIVVENEFQQTRLLRERSEKGCGLDAAWNDDFHHVARVALTGAADYYFGDYQGSPQELISAVKWGHLYQGQWNARQTRNRGEGTWDLEAARFINFLQNHDQVGNSPGGQRLHQLTSAARYRAMTALLLLGPGTPLIFQGQEFNASSPFHFFADHEDALRELVRKGREAQMRQFHRLVDVTDPRLFPDPGDRAVFESCKLCHEERQRHEPMLTMYRDLLKLRREDRVFAAQRADRIQGSVLGPEALALRFFGPEGGDRLLLMNLGRDLSARRIAEPLLAPSRHGPWRVIWASEDPRYGGLGASPWDETNVYVPGHMTLVLAPDETDACHGKHP